MNGAPYRLGDIVFWSEGLASGYGRVSELKADGGVVTRALYPRVSAAKKVQWCQTRLATNEEQETFNAEEARITMAALRAPDVAPGQFPPLPHLPPQPAGGENADVAAIAQQIVGSVMPHLNKALGPLFARLGGLFGPPTQGSLFLQLAMTGCAHALADADSYGEVSHKLSAIVAGAKEASMEISKKLEEIGLEGSMKDKP